MNKEQNIIDNSAKYLLDLVSAGIVGDLRKVEVIALSLARSLRRSNPEISKQIQSAISLNSNAGAAAIRSLGASPIPTDSDTHLEMAQVVSPSNVTASPIFNSNLNERILGIIEERNNMEMLLELDIKPSTSLLLIGQPGTGKTMLAHDIASKLNKNLIVLDLSSTISNLMGKTGHNIKKVLNYAKSTRSVLLLDEFDAIAKKRDDNTDLGEIKRVVNVLLMELENWPISSMIIATSNHPELLDRAIWRRFDNIIEIPLPENAEIIEILKKDLETFLNEDLKSLSIIQLISELLKGKNASDICKFSNNVKKRIVLRKEDFIIACLNELEFFTSDKKIRGRFCLIAKNFLGKSITVRKLSEITGLSPAGVQHHLSKSKHE